MTLDQQIYDTAIKNGFNPIAAKLIVAQARFESADYTSNVFKQNNNTSGIKFVGQPNAVQGTLSPEGNFYAKFNTIQDAINDKIARIYNLTMKGVTPQQLKDSTDAIDFANKLKQRGYFGSSASEYASGLKAKLLRINVLEFVTKNKIPLTLGIGVILIGAGIYYKFVKK
jgi:flagellum-specific peptidoglycan hydrolase FlgJ